MVKRILLALILTLSAVWLTGQTVSANSGAVTPASEGSGHALDPLVLIGVTVILVIAKLGGELFERFRQPAVLGELIGGITLGNLALAGFTAAEPLKTNEVIGALAEIGVIILLFEVGLESNLAEMMEVGWSSLLVAVAGVVAPFFLGWGVAAYFLPGESLLAHIFIGATLCATSVGITARVLKDMGKLQTREARIILGAAVIDDVLGLLILAVVAGAIKAAMAGAALSAAGVMVIAVKAVLFLVGAIAAGHYLVPHLFSRASRLETRGVLLALAVAFCFLLAWVASQVGLAPIVGAFAAGLVLDEAHFVLFRDHGEHRLDELLQPVSALLVPIFFVSMGLKVDLGAFALPELLGFASVLTLAAIIGKQACSLAVIERPINRLAIGLGMIPRGEVGLIFAGIGATLTLPNAQGVSEPVIGAASFGAVVIMVIITTLVTPPLLKWSLDRATLRSEPPDPGIQEMGGENDEHSATGEHPQSTI
ncbi:MAG: cation:proton antiporter [Acidobacteria bacterium]|nr:cation:proton antiporter [Acidobacteriota bacterium]